MDIPLIEVRDLKKYFSVRKGFFSDRPGVVRAVDGISFTVGKGEILGLVGESGCGKTTAGRVVLRLIEKSGGQVLYNGTDISSLQKTEIKKLRKKMQIIFQNPYSSFNPRFKVGSLLSEVIKFHSIVPRNEIINTVKEILLKVDISPSSVDKYPFEFSGGQLQRVAIARALSLKPDFIVADEPVSALDMSVQAQIINLINDLKENLGIAFLFISHDLSVIRHVSTSVAVMYLGKIVEYGRSGDLFGQPSHPYTRMLLSSIPSLSAKKNVNNLENRSIIPGSFDIPSGCRFRTRCQYVMEACRYIVPELKMLSDGHGVCCHLNDGFGLN